MNKLTFREGPLVSVEGDDYVQKQDNTDDNDTEGFILWRLQTGDATLFNNIFFYTNILWYLLYCSYIAGFSLGEYDSYDFKTIRDFCVEGSFYEVQNATHLS